MRNHGVFALYPLVPVTVSFILGLMAGSLLLPFVALYVWLAVTCLSLLACLVAVRHPFGQSMAILVLFFMFGGLSMTVADRRTEVHLPDEPSVYESVVASDPVERGRILRFEAIITSGDLRGKRVMVSLLKDTVDCHYRALSVNTGFVFSSRLEPLLNYPGSRFDYASYLKRGGVSATAFVYYRDWYSASIDMSGISLFQRARLAFLRYRHSLLSAYRHFGLDGQTFAVIAAMTLGYKSELSADIRNVYSITGVSHVLALSGMHLGIIYMFLSMLTLSRRPSLLREILLVIAVWSYVFLAGMPLSLIRAATMITVYSIMSLSGRGRMSLNVLAFTALLMLFINPLSIYDAGFQLSFVSVAGILILCPRISGVLPAEFRLSHPVVAGVWNLFVVSFVAQLATAPLVAYYFGRLPLVSLLANIVAVPALTFILYASILMMVFISFPSVCGFFALILSFVTSTLNTILSFLSSLPFASVSGIELNEVQVCAAYVMIVSLLSAVRILFTRRRHIVVD